MKKYIIEIELYPQQFTVSAKNENEAIEKAKDKFYEKNENESIYNSKIVELI